MVPLVMSVFPTSHSPRWRADASRTYQARWFPSTGTLGSAGDHTGRVHDRGGRSPDRDGRRGPGDRAVPSGARDRAATRGSADAFGGHRAVAARAAPGAMAGPVPFTGPRRAARPPP